MVEMLVVGSVASLLAAVIGALIALRIQHGSLNTMGTERRAWERTQEAHQNQWEIWQEKDAVALETRLTRQVQQIQQTWKEWEVKDQERIQALTMRFEHAVAQRDVEHELARLPLIEDMPLTANAMHSHQHTLSNWQPPRLQDVELSEHDLSHRYLGYADLRHARLSNANLYMADLSGAFLTGANLAGADLSGANLAGADLRDATLTGANLLVADLYGAILVGTNLRGARNLTLQQVDTAIYDSSTQFDFEIDSSRSRVSDLLPGAPASIPEAAIAEKPLNVMSTSATAASDEAVFAPEETALPTLPGEMKVLNPPQAEPSLSSPLPLDDNLLVPVAAGLPEDRQKNIHTEESNTATRSSALNGKK